MLKAVYIGAENAHAFMQTTIRRDWDWQGVVPTVNDFWDQLNTGAIDENTAVVVLSIEEYGQAVQNNDDETATAFLDTVYQLTSSALVMIVDYYDMQNQFEQELVAYAGSQNEGTLKRYWWIDFKKPLPSFDRAIKEYISSPDSDKTVVAQIANAEGFDVPDEQPGQLGVIDTITGKVNDIISNKQEHNDEYEETKYTNNYGTKGYLICVTSSKGGAGKTTTALAMGTWLAKSSQLATKRGMLPKPLKVCIVDLDVHDSQIGAVIGAYKPTILNLAMLGPASQQTVSKTVIYADRLNCWFLLSPRLPDAADSIPVSTFKESIQVLQEMFDVVLLDTSVDYTDPLFSKVVYPMADKIVFVSTVDKKAVVGMGRWMAYIGSSIQSQGSGIDLNKVKVLINQAENVSLSPDEIEMIITRATMKAYKTIDESIPQSEQHTPKIVAAVPDIPNGWITRVSNMQQFDRALDIKDFQSNIGKLCRNVMPAEFKSKLPYLDNK